MFCFRYRVPKYIINMNFMRKIFTATVFFTQVNKVQ